MTPGLIERLEKAEGGSRELDREVWQTTGGWDGVDAPPSFTTSLDAALALAERVLPELTRINVSTYVKSKYHHCEIETDDDEFAHFNATTPALALCIAILKARATQEQG